MGVGDKETAAARLRLLREKVTAPAGARRPEPARRTPPSQSGAPIDLRVLDYMANCRSEMVAQAQAITPNAGKAPTEEAAVVDWLYQQTARAAPHQRLARDAMVLRQSWEHALALGDTRPVHAATRWETCPACGCFSLFWQPVRRIVACTNGQCEDEAGLPTVWQLNQIAELCITRRNSMSMTAT
jgi:hypothetical protein